MTSYEFTLKLNREVTDDEIDARYEAGCDDAGIETVLSALWPISAGKRHRSSRR